MGGNTQLELLVTRMQVERDATRVLWRLVCSLETAFRIAPHDYGLVDALGMGSERSNHEALYTWVNRQLRVMDPDLATRVLPELTERLERALRRWELGLF